MCLIHSCASAIGAIPKAPSEPSVGFIWHYPFVDEGTSAIPKSGATAMDSRAVWLAIEQEQGKFDFSTIDRQIEFAEKNNLKLALILEMNPFAKPQWVMEAARKADEVNKDFVGGEGGFPRHGSRVMTEAQETFLARLVDHLKTADKNHVITHYHAGIEWWFPYTTRYAEADVALFRGWLARKYGSIAKLDASWDSTFPSFDAVLPPMIGDIDLYKRKREGLARMAFVGRDADPATRPYKNTQVVCDDWYNFWMETAADYINSLARMAKRHDPTRKTATFLTFSFAFPAEWDYVQWGAIRLDEVAMRAKDVDVLGMQLTLGHGDPYRIAAALDVARKYGKPMWDMDLLDFAAGVGIGKAKMMKGTHAAIQHGASGLFYCCWNGAKDFNFYPDWRMEDLNEMLTGARKAIKIMEGYKADARVALVEPILPVSPDDASGTKNEVGSFIGWYKLIEQCHTTVDVVTLREMEKGADLSKYRWILVPDCAYLPRDAAGVLSTYSKSGGKVISAGRFGSFDEVGRPLDSGALPRVSILPDYGKTYAGKLIRDGHAGDTPPMVAINPTSSVQQRALSSAKEAITRLGLQGDVEIVSDADIRCVEYSKGKDRAFYLVNMSDTPASAARLRIRNARARGMDVYADLQPVECASKRDGDWIEIALPRFDTSCIVTMARSREKICAFVVGGVSRRR